MDHELGAIDIEGKSLAYSAKDLQKLKTEEGCSLNLVTDKVYKIDDNSHSDDEEEKSAFEDSQECLTKQSKLDRMQREYISLVLNSNRDFVKPGSENNFRSRLDLGDEFGDFGEEDANDEILELANLDGGCSRIHKRYAKLGKYDEILNNKDNSFEEVSPGRVFKRRLTPGSGSLVPADSMVIYNCAFWTEKSSEPYDSTWTRRNTIVSDLSADSLLPGLLELLLTTKRGEWCEAFIKPEAAFGPLGAMPRIPPNATIFCLLEVVRVVSRDKISQFAYNPDGNQRGSLCFQDLYEAGDEARRRGNYFYEQKQHKAAMQRYKSGIRILEMLTYKDDIEEAKGSNLLVRLYNNCARAANAVGDHRFALACCKQATLLDEMEPRTHWAKVVAWKKLGHLDRALGAARRAMQMFSDTKINRSFRNEATELKDRIQTEKVELDDLHRLMSRAILT